MSEPNSIIKEDLENIIAHVFPWDRLANKEILVTGAGGFLGAYFVKTLLHAHDQYHLGLKLYALGRSSLHSYYRLNSCIRHPAFHFIQHDLAVDDSRSIPSADFIVHAASQASPKFYGIDPVGTLLPNIKGTMNLLDVAKENPSCRFMLFSSGSVYGEQRGAIDGFSESDYGWLDPLNIRSCYAESKRMAETMCASWSHQFGIDTSIVRPFHTYGPEIALDDGRVFADFISDTVNKRSIVIKSDGTATRSFCYITDAIKGFFTVLFNGKTANAYNIGNPKEQISVKGLADLLMKLFPDRVTNIQQEAIDRGIEYLPSPVVHSFPSIDKINELGWKPVITLEEGFFRTVSSFIDP